ncbi:MAG: helix-turn-helix domain-containing protein [Candidatus Binatia bacterium]
MIIEDESLRQFVGGFTSVPNRILRNSAITLGARMCYAMLLSYAWQEDFCFPAQIRLAEDLGIGERTVRQYLNELREAGLITWKQQGLNRPNIYRILKLPALASAHVTGHPGPADSAAPDRHDASGQDRHPAAAYKDSRNNTQVVNDVTPNDHERTPKGNRPRTGSLTISDRALRSTYDLTDDQIGRVHHLVEKQVDILGARDRNHPAYVKRAAEAVRDGLGDALDFKLGDFKQAVTEIAVGSRPAYFHAMWTEETENRRHPTPPIASQEPQPGGNTLGNLSDHSAAQPADIDLRIARLITDAEHRGFPIPPYIHTADLQAVNRWWAALPDAATKQP